MEGVLCAHLDILTIVAEYTIYSAEEQIRRKQKVMLSPWLGMIKREYIRYLLVCKAFYTVFIKIVWHRVEVGNLWRSTRRNAVALFEDHKSLVHELSLSAREFYPDHYREVDEHNAFICSKTGNRENKKRFSPLLNSVLRHITSPGSVLQPLEIGADMIPRTWWMTLLQVNSLKSLTINGGPQLSMQIPTGDEELFLQVCSKMSKLHIDFVSFETWPAALRNSDMAAPTKFLGIRHFRIGVLSLGGGLSTLHNDHREHIMVRGCQNLRSLAWTCSGLHGFDRRNGTEYNLANILMACFNISGGSKTCGNWTYRLYSCPTKILDDCSTVSTSFTRFAPRDVSGAYARYVR